MVKLRRATHCPLLLHSFPIYIHKLLTWVAGFSKTRESKAMVENTHVFPVPDLACTIKSETEYSEI